MMVIAVVLLIASGLVFLNQAQAYSADSNSVSSGPSFESTGNLSSPITDFVNSAKQISVNLTPRGTGFSFGSPPNILDQVGDWFYRATGLRLGDIVKNIGALLIYILTAITSLLKWVVGQL